jgi:hypothetical protein
MLNCPLSEHWSGKWLFSLVSVGCFLIYESIQLVISIYNEKQKKKNNLCCSILKGIGRYITSAKNIFELLTLILFLVALFSGANNQKSSLLSLAILLSSVMFLLKLDKFPGVGLTVMVMRKELRRTIVLLPIVVILFSEFVIAFRVRSTFAAQNSADKEAQFNKSPSLSTFLLFKMLFGDFEVGKLGLGHSWNFSLWNINFFEWREVGRLLSSPSVHLPDVRLFLQPVCGLSRR